MTICIAARANNNSTLILAADKKATMPGLGSNEDAEKIRGLTDKIYMLMAGDANVGNEVYKRASALNPKPNTVAEWAAKIGEIFAEIRFDYVETGVLRTKGYDRNSFQANQNTLHRDYIQQIISEINNYHPQEMVNSSYIVAGIDDSDKQVRIFTVNYPGLTGVEQAQDYVTAGSGATHAIVSLYYQSYKQSLQITDATYLVFEAKRVSQAVDDVGEETSMLIVTPEGAEAVPKQTLTLFKKTYDEILQASKGVRAEKLHSTQVGPADADSPPKSELSKAIEDVKKTI